MVSLAASMLTTTFFHFATTRARAVACTLFSCHIAHAYSEYAGYQIQMYGQEVWYEREGQGKGGFQRVSSSKWHSAAPRETEGL